MKKFVLVLIFCVSLTSMFGQNITLKEFADKEGVTTVTLSKNMLSLFPKSADLSYGGVNVADFLDKLSSINIFASPKADAANMLVKNVTEFMDTSGYDKLMSMKTEKEENINFYIRSNEEYISELILIMQRKTEESAVMQFIGKFTMDDIKQMIAKAGK